MLEKEDAELVGFGVAGNVLALHTITALVRLGVIRNVDAIDLIDRARENFVSKSELMSDQRVAEFALSFFDLADMLVGNERL